MLSVLDELFKEAREKVIQDGYVFKKGYSRSASSSSSSGFEGQSSSRKEAEKKLKRKRIDAEERQRNITNIKALIESTNEHIRIKQLRIQKLKTCNDFQQCDVLSKETTELLAKKIEYESQLDALEKKESKSKWYKKKAKSVAQSSSESSARPVGIARMLSNFSKASQPVSNENVPSANPADLDIQRTDIKSTAMDSSASTILCEEPSSLIIDLASQTNVSSSAVVHSDSSADTLPIDSDQELF